VEAATKIRARFLRAIEDEEWDALPGDVYARSFIRAYASYLGLDGERFADEYRRHAAAADEERAVAVAQSAQRAPRRRRRRARRAATAAVVAGLAGAGVAIGLATGGSEPTAGTGDSRGGGGPGTAQKAAERDSERSGPAPRSVHELELTATAEVWVCLLDARGEPLVDGQVLPAGAAEGPFRSGSFTASFGNGEVSMKIDGQEAEIPATPSPVGYAIGGDGRPQPLAEGERPECL
jgi:cytoskeleton protein RodZ